MAFVALGMLTYTLVNVTWVFFRAKTFGKAWIVLRGMAGQNADTRPILSTFNLLSVGVIVGGILITHWLMRARTLESVVARAPALAGVRGLGAHGICDRDRAGGRKCLHLLPVLTAPHATPMRAETASDRPGVAQPVPAAPGAGAALGTDPARDGAGAGAAGGGWEHYWRAYGVTPSIAQQLWAVGHPASAH